MSGGSAISSCGTTAAPPMRGPTFPSTNAGFSAAARSRVSRYGNKAGSVPPAAAPQSANTRRDKSSFAVLLDHPRIEQHNADSFEVGNVARHNRQTVNYRGCGDHGIALRARIRDMKARTVLRHRGIDGENAPFEARQELFVDPGAQDCTLCGVPACDFQCAQLNLKDGDGREKKARRRKRAGPRYDILICPLW